MSDNREGKRSVPTNVRLIVSNRWVRPAARKVTRWDLAELSKAALGHETPTADTLGRTSVFSMVNKDEALKARQGRELISAFFEIEDATIRQSIIDFVMDVASDDQPPAH